MVVVYYTQTYFLDAALETIFSIKNTVDLHLIIELTPHSKKSTIIDIDSLNSLSVIEKFEKVIGTDKSRNYQYYLNGLSSVNFVIFKQEKVFSYKFLNDSVRVGKFISSINPDIIHFDTITLRSLAILPHLQNLKKYITIHDPIAHTGEHSWKKKLTNFFSFIVADGFFFYSKFSKDQFESKYKKFNKRNFELTFQPFTFLKQFLKAKIYTPSAVLFFGRLSYYKGIDLLLDAIPIVLNIYPNQVFIIAGKSENYKIDYDFLKKYENNIIFLDKFLSINELVNLIRNSKFIICPYRDATQSGVLMTSHALGKVVLATNVGSFSEYIDNEFNGLIIDTNPESIAESIIKCLDNDMYKFYEKNINSNYSNIIGFKNQKSILTAYNMSL